MLCFNIVFSAVNFKGGNEEQEKNNEHKVIDILIS